MGLSISAGPLSWSFILKVLDQVRQDSAGVWLLPESQMGLANQRNRCLHLEMDGSRLYGWFFGFLLQKCPSSNGWLTTLRSRYLSSWN